MTELLMVAIWLLCGTPGFGITFAYFQRAWPRLADEDYGSDAATGLIVAIFGPIGTVVSFFLSGYAKHGLKFK